MVLRNRLKEIALEAVVCLPLVWCSGACAQTASGSSGWAGTLGVGPVLFPKYTGGRAMQAVPLPIAYVDYNGWFHVDLFRAGAFFWASDDKKQGLSFSMEPRIGFHAGEGARLAGMMTRRDSLFGGPTYNAENELGSMSLGYFADLSNASRGGYIDLLFNRALVKDKRWEAAATVQFTRQDSRVVNYYFGVTPAEVTARRALYTPGSATNGTIWLTGQYNLSKQYALMFGADVMRLGGNAAASPIVERRNVPFLYFGLGMNL